MTSVSPSPRSGRILIFTVGFHARATWRFLRRANGCEVIGFADNRAEVQGTTLFGLPVLAPCEIPSQDFHYIALPGRNQAVIREQLTSKIGLNSSRIWIVAKSEVRPPPEEIEARGQLLATLLGRILPVLKSSGVPFWAMHSALLGLIRGNDLVTFSDLDLCYDGSRSQFLAQVLESAFPGELNVRRVDDRPDAPIHQLTFSLGDDPAKVEPVVIDLHPIAIGPSAVEWSVNGQHLSLPSHHFDSTRSLTATYRGHSIPIPENPESVLSRLYGPDWGTPAECWNGQYTAVP